MGGEHLTWGGWARGAAGGGHLPLGRRREHDKLVACAQPVELQRRRHRDDVRAVGDEDPLEAGVAVLVRLVRAQVG